MNKISVLDHGFVGVVCANGGDLMAVNAARVSYQKKHESITEADKKLIDFLVRNHHDSPLRHIQITLEIKAPEFVMRQWYKHVVGISYTVAREVDHAWNEASGRYIIYNKDEYYTPTIFRKQSKTNKQGTIDEEIEGAEEARKIYVETTEKAMESYDKLLALGVGREIARTVLPLNFYTKVLWTASLQAILNFIQLRNHKDAQYEIRKYARSVQKLVREIAPVILDAWEKHRKI